MLQGKVIQYINREHVPQVQPPQTAAAVVIIAAHRIKLTLIATLPRLPLYSIFSHDVCKPWISADRQSSS
jgi:hypothetical protein